MQARRSLAWSLLACASLLPACAWNRPLDFPTAEPTAKPAPRKPDGVAVDLEGTLPGTVTSARTEAGFVALREPIAQDAALEAVRAFFQAVRQGDMPALRQTITPEASFSPIGSGSGGPADAQWERRLRKFEYRNLGGSPLYLDSAVEIYRYADLDEVIGDRPARPALMTANDILIRVPMATTRLGIDRVFGDEIQFVVRRADRAFRIQAIYEDFQVP